jgi:hypothetical protein
VVGKVGNKNLGINNNRGVVEFDDATSGEKVFFNCFEIQFKQSEQFFIDNIACC